MISFSVNDALQRPVSFVTIDQDRVDVKGQLVEIIQKYFATPQVFKVDHDVTDGYVHQLLLPTQPGFTKIAIYQLPKYLFEETSTRYYIRDWQASVEKHLPGRHDQKRHAGAATGPRAPFYSVIDDQNLIGRLVDPLAKVSINRALGVGSSTEMARRRIELATSLRELEAGVKELTGNGLANGSVSATFKLVKDVHNNQPYASVSTRLKNPKGWSDTWYSMGINSSAEASVLGKYRIWANSYTSLTDDVKVDLKAMADFVDKHGGGLEIAINNHRLDPNPVPWLNENGYSLFSESFVAKSGLPSRYHDMMVKVLENSQDKMNEVVKKMFSDGVDSISDKWSELKEQFAEQYETMYKKLTVPYFGQDYLATVMPLDRIREFELTDHLCIKGNHFYPFADALSKQVVQHDGYMTVVHRANPPIT